MSPLISSHSCLRPATPSFIANCEMVGKAVEQAGLVADSNPIPLRKLIATLLAISFGTVLEWYDYSVSSHAPCMSQHAERSVLAFCQALPWCQQHAKPHVSM